jgi:hypothetical protein
MRFTHRRYSVVLLFLTLVAGGCTGSPKVVESWKDPNVTGPLRFKKILVMVVHPDAYTRRVGEDELARAVGPDRAVQAEQLLTDAERADLEKLKAKVKQSGVDGVVTMRVAGTGTHPSAPGSSSYSYDAFWKDDGLPVMGRPDGPTPSHRAIQIRTRIYSVADERLVWDGVSEAFDWEDARDLIGGIAKAVSKRLREEHLIE